MPIALAIAALVIAAASSAAGAYSAYEQAGAQKKLVEQQAEAAQVAAAEEERQRDERRRQIIAAQRAYFGAAGIPSGEGSALALQLETQSSAMAEDIAARRLAAIERASLKGQASLAGFRRTMVPVTAGLQFADQAVGVYHAYQRGKEPPKP